jgi:ATP-dependent helicase/nuclease subunit A
LPRRPAIRYPHAVDTAGPKDISLTPSQRDAIAARGNVLVMAGAGTGKTQTLVQRCLDLVRNDRVSLDEMLIVTFTEAAATEMRERLREGLEKATSERPADTHLPEQLALFDAAHIGTLHSFCFKLVREHFHALGLDPRLTVLEEAQARLLAGEILEEQFQSHYENADDFSLAVQDLITVYGNGRDETIRALVLRLHHYTQTRGDAGAWIARQIEGFSSAEPAQWREWYGNAVQEWREEWAPILRALGSDNVKAAECAQILEEFPADIEKISPAWGSLFGKIAAADGAESYPMRKKTVLRKPLEGFFDDAEFLASLLPTGLPSPLDTDKLKDAPPDGLPAQPELEFSPPAVPAVAGQGTSAARGKSDVPARPIQQSNNPLTQNAVSPQTAIGNPQSADPLAEDWEWSRGHMKTLLLLANGFSETFAARKRAEGVVDFHDLEQFAIKLLWDNRADGTVAPTAIAGQWRQKLRFIFVDEYQDINAAQDKIIRALGPDNRFLVGDVKQSIYRFRLADPTIFRNYAKNPGHWNARIISLNENFRSREGLLDCVNSLFKPLMSEDIGGVLYDEQAKLKFGAPATRAELSTAQSPGQRVELLLREKKRGETGGAGDDVLADLQESEWEALTVALRLRELKESGEMVWANGEFREARWSDFAVLLRSPGSKAELYAKQFHRAGVPLLVERGGFYDSSEISDLLSVLQLADNPLQDVPCIAVLRSPLVGCSLNELAEIRLAARGHYWFALNRASVPGSGLEEPTRVKIEKFLRRFSKWRILARQVSLSECLETVLTDTHYDDWLLSRPRGGHRRANVRRFLHLAEAFDVFQRQGLFRFLKFVEAQREIEAEPDIAPLAEENAVRLMSIHQSKGLEFPVVALADLGKTFNEQDLRGEIILDEQFGLCPRIKPPSTGGRYPSLAYWLARKKQRRELRGEELRLLYVAMTRARDRLILSGAISEKKAEGYFLANSAPAPRHIASANSCMDWLAIWFASHGSSIQVQAGAHGESPVCWRVVDDSKVKGVVLQMSKGGDLQIGDTARLPRAAGVSANDHLKEILGWKYPFEAATRRAAKTSVTALRREATDDEAEQPFQRARGVSGLASASRGAMKLSAADFGVAHHKFLQHFAFESAADLKSFVAEAKRLEQENYLSAEEAEVLDLEALLDFWTSRMGRAIRANASSVRREVAFTAGFAPVELDEILRHERGAGLNGEMIVVQGVVDLAVFLPNEIWLVDFKTDEVSAKSLREKVASYSPQLKLYARALEKIYSRKVTDCRLHFLAPKKTVAVPAR